MAVKCLRTDDSSNLTVFFPPFVDELEDLLICMLHRSWTMAESGQTPCPPWCSFSPVAFLSKPIQIHKIAGSCRQLLHLGTFCDSSLPRVLGCLVMAEVADVQKALEQQRAERHRAEQERRQLVQRGGREAKMRTQMDLAKKRAKKASREIWLGRMMTLFCRHDAVEEMSFEQGSDGWCEYLIYPLVCLSRLFMPFFLTMNFLRCWKSHLGFSLRWRRWIFALWWTWRLPCNGGWRQ